MRSEENSVVFGDARSRAHAGPVPPATPPGSPAANRGAIEEPDDLATVPQDAAADATSATAQAPLNEPVLGHRNGPPGGSAVAR